MTKSKTSKSNNSYGIGDRVFAKLKGYPWWPARIETVENQTKPIKYKILFYATYEINLIKPDCLVPFNKENIERYGEPRKYKYFNEAMNEIQNDPDLKNLKRRSESEDSSDSESSNDLNSNTSGKNSEKTDSNEFDETERVDVEKQSTERSTSDLESKTESEKSFRRKTRTKKSDQKKSNLNEPKPTIQSEEKDADEKMEFDVTKKVDVEKQSTERSTSDLESKTESEKSFRRKTKTKKLDLKMTQFKKKSNKNEKKSKVESEEKEKMDVGHSEIIKSAESNSDPDSQAEYVKKTPKRPLDDDFDFKSISTKTRRIISDDEDITEKVEDNFKKEQENTTEETREENQKKSNVLTKDKTNLIKTEDEENSDIVGQKKTETKKSIDKIAKAEKCPKDEDKAEGKQKKIGIKQKSNKI